MNNFNNNAGAPYNGTFSQPAYNNNQQNTGNFQSQWFSPSYNYGNSPNFQSNYNQPQNYQAINNSNMAGNYSFTNQPNLHNYNYANNIVPNAVYNPKQTEKQIKMAKEKRDFTASSNRSAAGLLIFSLISEFLCVILMTFIAFTGAYNPNNMEYINGIEPVTMYILNSIVCLVGFGVSAIIITKLNKLRMDDVLKIKKVAFGDTVKFTIASMGFVYVFNLLLMIMNINLSLFGYENKMSDLGDVNGFWGNVIYFVSIAIVPPIIEEFIFRGAILGSLRKHGDAFAVIVSAVLFGFMHANFIQTPVTFLTGLILGYLTVKTNSIIPAIILHFVNNAWAATSEILMDVISDEKIYNIIDLGTALALIGVGLICAISLIKKYKNDLFTFEKPDSEFTMSQKLRYSFTTPCMILFTIYTVIMCFVSAIIL